jgi:hypothetical protein
MKKLGLLIVAFILSLSLISCDDSIDTDTEQAESVVDKGNTTEPEETESEETEPAQTEAEDTEPEDTQPEDTEPEDTEPPIDKNALRAELYAYYLTEKNNITTKYQNAMLDCRSMYSQYQSMVSSLSSQKSSQSAMYDRQISNLERARDDAVGQANAMSGGYGNSYADSIARQYDSQISALKQEKNSVISSYNSQISSYSQQAQSYLSMEASLKKEMNELLTDLDIWYAVELSKIDKM